jgi:hypothetical protein
MKSQPTHLVSKHASDLVLDTTHVYYEDTQVLASTGMNPSSMVLLAKPSIGTEIALLMSLPHSK